MTRKVAVYVRVSTLNQVEEGYSIDGQLDSLTKYCEAMGWSIYNRYIDAGFSGGKLDRPDMMKLIHEAKKGLFDTVLVYKLDRLSRNVRDTLYLVKEVFNQNDVHFVSLQENLDTSSAMGNLFLTLLSAIAEFEREQIKERMQLGKIGRAKAGKAMMWARVAYGYDYDQSTGELTVNEAQAIVIREIFADYLSGMTIRKIKNKLDEKYPKDPKWSYRAIRIIVENPVYCGKVRYKKEIYQGNHEPIVSVEDFEAVQREIQIRQVKAFENYGHTRPFQGKYMLAGIVKCGYCNAPLRVMLGKIKKDGTRPKYYQCYQKYPRNANVVSRYNDNRKCDSGTYRMENIEDFVIKEISKLQNDKDYLDSVCNSPKKKIDRESVQKQIDTLNMKISRLNDLYIDERITLDELKKKSNDFLMMRKTLELELENDEWMSHENATAKLKKALAKGDVLKMDYENQKMLVNSLISKVIVTSDDIVISWKL